MTLVRIGLKRVALIHNIHGDCEAVKVPNRKGI